MMANSHQSTHACFIFTREMLQLTQEALSLFKQSFQRRGYQGKKAIFAEQTVQSMCDKLAALSRSNAEQALTTFDSNEKVILAAAMQLYALDLLSTPTHVRRDLKFKQCQHILEFARAR